MVARVILRSFFICIFYLMIASNSYCQLANNYPDLIHFARQKMMSQDYKDALPLFEKAFSIKKSNIADDVFLFAKCLVLSGDAGKSEEMLSLAAQRGFRSKSAATEPAFDSIRQTSKGAAIFHLFELNRKQFLSGLNNKLIQKLDSMFTLDQKFRKMLDSIYRSPDPDIEKKIAVSDSIMKYDSLNVKELVTLIKRYGWPGINKVGEFENNTAFLVLQHAPDEVQNQYLDSLKLSITEGNSPTEQLAYLVDRMLTRQQKKQIYGTQTFYNDKTKRYELTDIDDLSKANQLRHNIGMTSVEIYLQEINKQ